MSKSRRYQVLTDPAIQGELLYRAMFYWICCLLVIATAVMTWSLLNSPGEPFSQVVWRSFQNAAPALVGVVILLPFLLIDVLRVSNRFVGPMQRVGHCLRQLARKEPCGRIYLRRNDYWQDLANHTNLIAEELETSREADSDEEEEAEEEEDFNIPCTDQLAEPEYV